MEIAGDDAVGAWLRKTPVVDSSQVLLIGDQLREKVYRDNPEIIKDRRYHFRSYQRCFVGHQMVDWLIKTLSVPNRNTAVLLMRILQENDILHHVCDDHLFKDEMLFFRFRKDDGTFPRHKESDTIVKGPIIISRLQSSDLIGSHEENYKTFHNCFLGNNFVDWLISQGEVTKRTDAVVLGREILEHGLMKHVTDDHHFKDSDRLYQCCPEQTTQMNIMGLLRNKVVALEKKVLDKQVSNPEDNNFMYTDRLNGRTVSASSCDSQGDQSSQCSSVSSSVETTVNRSVLLREVSADELEDSGSPYVRKNIKVISDSVGYGFVLRGNGPCYVQTVDPDGPAALAGIKVRQYIYSVNGQNVLRVNHRDASALILQGSGFINLEVLIHFREVSL